MNSDSSKIGVIIKLLLAIGITMLLLWKMPVQSDSKADALKTILMIMATTYILISIFILMHRACSSYLFALILTVIAVFLLGYAENALVKQKILTTNVTYYLALAVGILLVLIDIGRILHHFIEEHK